MSLVVVGIGDCRVSANPEDVLVTYALGSCIAVVMHDPVAQIGGLLHFLLPDSRLDAAKAVRNPFAYADTAIPLLLQRAYAAGAERSRSTVRVAGGAQLVDANGVFNVGKRNCLAMRKLLWKESMLVNAEAVGGSLSRTVRLEVGSGKLWVRGSSGPEVELASTRKHPKEELWVSEF